MKKVVLLSLSFIFCIIAVFYIVDVKNHEIQALRQTVEKQNETIKQLQKITVIPEEEKVVQECMKNANYTTTGMTNCVNDSTKRWNKKIDNSIISLKKVLSSDDYRLLENSQQKWKEYKEAQWAFLENFYSQKDGTIYSNILSADKSEIVKHRAQELDGLHFE